MQIYGRLITSITGFANSNDFLENKTENLQSQKILHSTMGESKVENSLEENNQDII